MEAQLFARDSGVEGRMHFLAFMFSLATEGRTAGHSNTGTLGHSIRVRHLAEDIQCGGGGGCRAHIEVADHEKKRNHALLLVSCSAAAIVFNDATTKIND